MKKRNFLTFARLAAKIGDDKKSSDIVLMNVRRLTPIADYFIIMTVQSTPQMRAVLDTIEEEFKKEGLLQPVHREGKGATSWGILDYGGLIIHVMTPDARRFYALEKLWSDAKKVK